MNFLCILCGDRCLPDVKSSLHSSVREMGSLLGQPPARRNQYIVKTDKLPAKAAVHVDQPLRLELCVEVDGAPDAKREKR